MQVSLWICKCIRYEIFRRNIQNEKNHYYSYWKRHRRNLAENNVNVLDISQTIVQDYFNMMMIADINAASKDFDTLSTELKEIGVEIGVKIKMQHEDIFNSMHRI